jgi:endoglucanase
MNAFDHNKRLGRGINLSAMEAPHYGDWDLLTEEHFRLTQEAGFQSARIPIRWSAYALTEPPYTIAPEFFAQADWALNQSLARGLTTINDLHHYLELFEDPAAHRQRFLALWAQLAEHYQAYPDNLFFELCNEPNTNLTADLWNDLLVEAVAVIRQSNPTRTLIIGGADWNGFRQLETLRLPDDPNLIATFHYYLPMEFTHQGASWVAGSDAWLGTHWIADPAETMAVSDDFERVAAWSRQHNRPIYLGEFGAYEKADLPSRVRWTRTVARAAEAHGFSWGYWELFSGFGVYDPRQAAWNDALRKALIPA